LVIFAVYRWGLKGHPPNAARSAQEGLSVPGGLKRLYQVGGISLVVSGALFLVGGVLGVIMGPPPSNGAEILDWMASRKLPLALLPEVLFFAALFLVPPVYALHKSLASSNRFLARTGCGIIAVTIPLLFMLIVVHGRLSYPVFHIRVHSPEIAEFTIAIYYGGMHAVALLFSIATFVLSLAMLRGPFGRNIAYLGFATAAFDLASAYPEAIGPIWYLVCSVFFAAWFAAVGFALHRMPATEASK
jgi:hypothetical protein